MLEVMVTMLGALTIISINGSILDDFALYEAGDGAARGLHESVPHSQR